MNTLPENTIQQMLEVFDRLSSINADSQITLTLRKPHLTGIPFYFYANIGDATSRAYATGTDLLSVEKEAVEKWGTEDTRRVEAIESLRKQAEKLGVTISE